MLSPTSRAPKNVSEEDSSGSDAGSEVGLEPETDRFGFILTNGSTAGSVGPPPELVRQRETKWINIMSQWDRILLKKTSKVKVQCQKGIPASLRAKCWPLLCGATDKMKQSENLYQSLDSQPALQSWVDVIERDLDRQFPFHEMFLSKDGHGQRGLFRVLKAYTQYQPEEGYCQAQGPVAAVLLMNMPAEEAFWCVVQISEQYLPGYYSPLLEGVLFDAAMLTWVLKRTCPAAHKHLQRHGVEPLMFATDWLMCLFTRHLPFNTLLRVWDLFFCYGVRVLLQVAAVLVRRVLGRAEQRKQCQGQMETLERLRGVREEVHEEDDIFIAEVCSVQLSARDLEKQTEKELEKWRKDRPSSTFDPRGRCQGYRMAWARARQNEEERDRKEREKGNLSVPLARSASTLSLSPSLLQKKWRKGGKANTREWDGGGRVVRHLSMGAKDDWRSWNELNFKRVQGVQEEEDVVFEERKKQSEPKLTGLTEQKEVLEEPEQVKITEQVEERVIEKDEAETRITEKEESPETPEESKVPSEQMEETNVETEATKDQTLENVLQPVEHKQEEEVDSNQSQALDQQSHKSKHLETEVKDTNKEPESDHPAAEEDADGDKNTEVEAQESERPSEDQMIQADVKPEERTEAEHVQQTQVDTTETSPETDSKHPIIETQQEEVISETDTHSQGEYHSTESLAETDMKAESHTQTETETHQLVHTQEEVEENASTQETEAEMVQTEASEQDEDTKILSSAESVQPKGGTDFTADTETEAEAPGADNTVTESSEASEPAPAAHSQARLGDDPTEAEETPAETKTGSTAPPSPAQAQAETLTAEPDGKTSSVDTSTSEEPAPEQPASQVPVGAVEEEEKNTEGEDDVFVSTEPTDAPNTDSSTQVQDKDSPLARDQAEPDNCGVTPASGHRSSRTSGDFCIRKSSSSRGSRLACRLSEDLFTMPERTSPSQSAPHQPEVKPSETQSSPGAVNSTQSPPDVTSQVTSSAEVAERAAVQQEPPKRFGLFRRLRGEQHKKTKDAPKLQVPKILIQDFSDGTGMGKPVEEEAEEKLSSRERRRRRRDRERREKEEERLRKKREKELGKEKEREKRKPQTRGKSFQVQREKGSSDVTDHRKTGSSQTLRYSASYAESYF